jgi:hypothetical protein
MLRMLAVAECDRMSIRLYDNQDDYRERDASRAKFKSPTHRPFRIRDPASRFSPRRCCLSSRLKIHPRVIRDNDPLIRETIRA